MTTPINKRNLLFVDTETTGLDPNKHEIVEIFMTKTSHDVIANVDEPTLSGKHWLVMPEFIERADPRALDINGFDKKTWEEKGAKFFEDYAERISQYMEGCTIVGFNPWFDIRFLMAEFSQCRWEQLDCDPPKFHYHAIDLCSMAWPLFAAGLIQGVSAKHICEFFKIPYQGAHRADVDVALSIECYKNLCQMSIPAKWL